MQLDLDSTTYALVFKNKMESNKDILTDLRAGAITPGGIPLGKPKYVLIEGPAGAGKSTLTRQASQEWAKGNLFEDLDLLIRISHSDSAVREASSLADLIPHPDRKILRRL